jgi:ketosteroid isomerase-like protein
MERDEHARALAGLIYRQEIEQVILGLARATDRRDVEAIRSSYHADAVDDHGAFQGSGAQFAEWVPKALAPFAATQHLLSPPRIELDGDVAHAETYCTAHHVYAPDDPGGERDSIIGLRYVDRFERRGGQWRIARRRCVFDYSYIVAVVERWPFGPGFRLGSPSREDPSYAR